MTVLAVFRSRAQTLAFVSALRKSGVPASTVSTPKEAGVGCGISAKLDFRFLDRARTVFRSNSYSSFSGWMRETGGAFYYF